MREWPEQTKQGAEQATVKHGIWYPFDKITVPGAALAEPGARRRWIRDAAGSNPAALEREQPQRPSQGLKKRTAERAILQRLMEIMVPDAPLIKSEAWDRCEKEVPGAYLEAFKKAWKLLPSERKRGRGKHGPRALNVRETFETKPLKI
jgi:hypothetical protein